MQEAKIGIDTMLTAEKYRKTAPNFETDDRESNPDQLLDSNQWIDLMRNLRTTAYPGEDATPPPPPNNRPPGTAVVHWPLVAPQDSKKHHKREVGRFLSMGLFSS